MPLFNFNFTWKYNVNETSFEFCDSVLKSLDYSCLWVGQRQIFSSSFVWKWMQMYSFEKKKNIKHNFYVCRIFWHFCNADCREWMVLERQCVKNANEESTVRYKWRFFFFLNASQPIYGKIISRRVSFIQQEF